MNHFFYTAIATLVVSQVAMAEPISVKTSGGSLLGGIKNIDMQLKPSIDYIPTTSDEKQEEPKGSTRKVSIKKINLTGVSVFKNTTFDNLIKSYQRDVSLRELNQLCAQITKYYRDKGYVLSRAYVPAQKVKNGEIVINVLEGKLDKVIVHNNSSLIRADVIDGYVKSMEKQVVHATPLQRQMLLLNDLGGISVKSTLSPGSELGTSNLNVQTQDVGRFNGYMSIDNFNNYYTNQERLIGNLNINSPTGSGDLLSLTGLVSGPDMQYGRVGYQIPVGFSGSQVGGSLSYLGYGLGEEYEELDANGDALTTNLFAAHPIIRSRDVNVFMQGDYAHKKINDRIGYDHSESTKSIDSVKASMIFEFFNGLASGGMTKFDSSVTIGSLGLDDASFSNDDATYQTHGNYKKFNAELSHIQNFPYEISLLGKLSTQQTTKNLDSSEKASLGGVYGVRAYPDGESSSDIAVTGTAEIHYAISSLWDINVFYDYAAGSLQSSPLSSDEDNHRNLSGFGVGTAYQFPHGVSVSGMAAWKTGDAPTTKPDRTPQLWVRMAKTF